MSSKACQFPPRLRFSAIFSEQKMARETVLEFQYESLWTSVDDMAKEVRMNL